MQGVGGGGGVVAGQALAEGCGEGLGQDAQDDVEVDVEVHRGGQRVEAERADDLGEALFDGHPPRVVLDQRLDRLVGVVGDDDGGGVAAEAGDDQLADGAGVVGQLHTGHLVHLRGGVLAGAVQRDRGVRGGGDAADLFGQRSRAGAQGEELDAAGVQLAQHGLGGDLGVEDQQVRVVPGGGFPVVAERDHFSVLGGFGEVGVGVDEVVGAGVLGEEGQHRPGALGPGGDVVLFQRGVLAPVHDGVEVQVEDGLAAAGEPGGDHGGVQRGEERALLVVAQPVGVVGQRGLLRQHRQPGEQRAGRVGEQVVDVGDPPGSGQFQRQQRGDPADRGHDRGARVAGGAGHAGKVEGDQVGDGQQQAGHRGVRVGGEGAEVDPRGPGQPGVAAGGGRAGALLRFGVAQQPAEPFLGQDLPDAGAVQRCALHRQPGADLIDRQAGPAQLDYPGPGVVFLRGALAAGLSRLGEQAQLPGPEVAHQRDEGPRGVAEPGGGFVEGRPLVQVGADGLVAPLVDLGWPGEHLSARP